MPKIQLKPHSPEFADTAPRADSVHRCCDMPGCAETGEYRAPKDRSLSGHYWFCLTHVSDYNKAWNFFEGMNDAEVQDHILKSLYGDRPTWRYDMDGEKLREKIWQAYHGEYDAPPPEDEARRQWQAGYSPEVRNSPEFEAMAIMGLEPPLSLDGVKRVYKELAKKYHPDRNPNDPNAEERLKKINMAYTVLKLAVARAETLI